MSMMDGGVPPTMNPMAPAPAEPNAIAAPPILPANVERNVQRPDSEAEASLVKELTQWCKDTKAFRSRTFGKMRRDMAFVRPGNQWKRSGVYQDDDTLAYQRPYEANLTQRHIAQRVATLYAKNPTVVAKRRKRMDFKIWDGKQSSLAPLVEKMTMGMPLTPEEMAMMAEIEAGMGHRQMIDRVAETLEILYRYYMREAKPTFKVQAKGLVRRALTTGVGIVQLGFQRMMGLNPDTEARLHDDTMRLRYLQTIASDIADDQITEDQPQAEELKRGIEGVQQEQQIVLREGLVFEFPRSTDILVDKDCIQLKGLINAKRVAREYHFTKRQVEQIFGVDLGATYTQYEPSKTWLPSQKSSDANVACVWKVWDVNTGLVYHVCDGFPAYLRMPELPDARVEQFFPFYFLSFNDIEDPEDIYPPSDVELIRPMQLEWNRSREGLREHRIANKPGYISAKGVFSADDKTKLMNHVSSGLMEMEISPAQVADIGKLMVGRPTVEIRPEVYSTDFVLQDFMLVSGTQEANLGPTGDSTATEASIAETSRVSSSQSNIDDLDEFLSDLARDSGQVMLSELSIEQVQKIAGAGAVWPEMSREEISEEIYLEIEAGSSGRPNKALEIANMERLAPLLIQIPGLSKEWLLKQMVKRLDDDVDVTDAFEYGAPAILSQNAIAQAGAAAPQPAGATPGETPDKQGGEGGKNAIGVPTSLPGPKPNFPMESTIDQAGGPLTH